MIKGNDRGRPLWLHAAPLGRCWKGPLGGDCLGQGQGQWCMSKPSRRYFEGTWGRRSSANRDDSEWRNWRSWHSGASLALWPEWGEQTKSGDWSAWRVSYGLIGSKAKECHSVRIGDILELWGFWSGLVKSDRVRRELALGQCPVDNTKGSHNRAELRPGCVAKEQNTLTILLVLLGGPTNVDTRDIGQWTQRDIGAQRYSIVKEFKTHCCKCNWWLGREGEDLLIVMFVSLAPLRGQKPNI